MTAIEIIEETVDYYGKDYYKRRGYDVKRGECTYKSSEGNKCAVGRCGNSKFDFDYEGGIYSYLEDKNMSNLNEHLFPRYRSHSKQLWYDLQNLHDDDVYWNDNGKGLSRIGITEVEKIKRKYV